jgi:hypothetical protein
MPDFQGNSSSSFIQEQQRAIARQDAFAALIESLRREAPASKPTAVADLDAADEMSAQPETVEIPCQDCGGSGGDGNAVDGWEPCSYCQGSGLEVTNPPATVPALVGASVVIAKRGVVSIGPGMFVRTGGRRS